MSEKHSNKYSSLANAISRLDESLLLQMQDGVMGEIMRDAIIQRFEFTLELAWKYMRFILIDEGIFREDVSSPKRAVQNAFSAGMITNGDIWLEMIRYRNVLSHTYNESEAIILEEKIRNKYIHEFKILIKNSQEQ